MFHIRMTWVRRGLLDLSLFCFGQHSCWHYSFFPGGNLCRRYCPWLSLYYPSAADNRLGCGAIEQIVGRERRERVSHHDWSGDA